MSNRKQTEAWLKHQKIIHAGKIKEQYPNIKKITFEFYYEDQDKLAKPSKKTFDYEENNSAFFEFDCPYRECVGGGHDLFSEIEKMIKNKKSESSGQISCQGWQDQERINKYHCLCKLTFKVKAYYK